MATKDTAALKEAGRKVLETLAQSGTPQAPKQIALATGLDPKLAGDAIKDLKVQGLVDSPVRCKYGLTPAGQASLKG